jgi:hypothetical protein
MKMNDKWWNITGKFSIMAAWMLSGERIKPLLGRTPESLQQDICDALVISLGVFVVLYKAGKL